VVAALRVPENQTPKNCQEIMLDKFAEQGLLSAAVYCIPICFPDPVNSRSSEIKGGQ
jgi:hypothetical protein